MGDAEPDPNRLVTPEHFRLLPLYELQRLAADRDPEAEAMDFEEDAGSDAEEADEEEDAGSDAEEADEEEDAGSDAEEADKEEDDDQGSSVAFDETSEDEEDEIDGEEEDQGGVPLELKNRFHKHWADSGRLRHVLQEARSVRYNMLSDSQIRTMGMRSVLVTESMTRMDILRELSREPALPVINNSPGHTVGTTFDEERMLIARYTFVKPKHQEELEGDILGRICAFGNLDRDDLDYTMQYRHLDQQAIALLYEASKPRARQQDNPHLLSLDAQLTFLAFSNRKIGQMVVGRRDTLRQADHLRFLSDTSLVSLHRLFIADQTPMAGNNGSIERDLVIRELCQREIMFAELPCSILQEIALSMGTLENVKDVESFEDLVKRASVYIVRYDTSAHLTLTTFHKPNGHGGKWSNYYSANCWDILPAFCSGNNCPDRTRVAAPIGAHVFVQEHAVPHGPAKRLVGIVPMCSKCNQYGENNAPNHQPMGPFKLVTILGERDGKATIAGKANPHKTDKRGNGRKRTTIFFRRSFYLEWGPKKLHMKTKKNSSRWSRSTSEVKGEFSLLRLIIQSLGGSPDESTGQLQREGHIVHKPQLYVCVPLHYRIRGTQDWFQTAEGAIPIVTEVIGTVGN